MSNSLEVDGLHVITSTSAQAVRLPVATYRLQFHAGFRFSDATGLLPYLHALGVSDIYASPYLKASSGSQHGYDVADPNKLNPEIGTEEEYNQFLEQLSKFGMGHILDVVPNHMGIADSSNLWWMDVLENGPSSQFANFFDIDWNPLRPEHQDVDKVILPILGDQYGLVLERGELVISYNEGAFFLHYYDITLPIAPDSYVALLSLYMDDLEAALGSENECILELQSIITAISHLPSRSERDADRIRERSREKEIIKRRIHRLYQECREFRDAVEATLRAYNGKGADSFTLMDGLLNAQAYRLAFWRVAAEEINYRRFFDVSELAALRMEDPQVFNEVHRFLLSLVQAGKVTGLRIDHPDGLWDPARYLWRLQENCFVRLHADRVRQAIGGEEAEPHQIEEKLAKLFERLRREDPASPLLKPMYIVVEKILDRLESLPAQWPVHGTTGYDFLNFLNGIFVERDNRRLIDSIYAHFVRANLAYPDVVNSAKKMVMLISLASEINELGYQLKRIAARDPRHRDFTLNLLTFAIREIIASLPVYRTYIDPETGECSESDRAQIAAAIADAKRRNPRTDPSLFDFVRDTLLLSRTGEMPPEERAMRLRFVAKFQQTSGPVMAKGAEDTAFYVYNRLVSLNEVGGDPAHFGVSLAEFHRQNRRRLHEWPYSMLTTSTHDSKRSEDVRARINVISEMPREWRAALTRWSRLNSRKKTLVDGRAAPDRNEEYLLYQTLLGAWPLGTIDRPQYEEFQQRIVNYMRKAIREAKVNTSWTNINTEYEAAVESFVRAVLDDTENPFLDDFHTLRTKVAHFGMFNSLSQTLLKIASPGVPDTYQGNETWNFSLVDPDNRRPVDFAVRARMLQDLQKQTSQLGADLLPLVRELLEAKEDGRIKLYITYKGLTYRREHPLLFAQGSYVPLRASGHQKRHICAFARSGNSVRVVVAAPVLITGLTKGALIDPVGEEIWRDTVLTIPGQPGDTYLNIFTGEVVEAVAMNGRAALPLKSVLRVFPVALLTSES